MSLASAAGRSMSSGDLTATLGTAAVKVDEVTDFFCGISSVESEAGWAGDLAQPRLAGQLEIVSLAGTPHDLYEWLIAVK